eukprot:1352106-Rhodomonas_salina.1
MAALNRNGQWKKALDMFQELEKQGVDSDVLTHPGNVSSPDVAHRASRLGSRHHLLLLRLDCLLQGLKVRIPLSIVILSRTNGDVGETGGGERWSCIRRCRRRELRPTSSLTSAQTHAPALLRSHARAYTACFLSPYSHRTR